jgi:hypothetical protein
MAQRSGQPYFFESEGFDSPWLPSILYLYSSRGTMPHHRASPLVPHLLTVRVTFIYFAAQSFDDSLPFKVNEHPTQFEVSLKPAV